MFFFSHFYDNSVDDEWEVCYSELLLQQQSRIANLLFEVEQENTKAMKLIYTYDPSETIQQLKELKNEIQESSREDREKIVDEFRQTIGNLIADFKMELPPDNASAIDDLAFTSSTKPHDISKISDFTINNTTMVKEMLDTPNPKQMQQQPAANNKTATKSKPMASSAALSQTTLVHSLPPKQVEPVSAEKQKKVPTAYENALKQTMKSSSGKSTSRTSKSPASSEEVTRSEIEQLKQQIATLNQHVNERAKGEEMLQEINDKLRERLDQYKSQNSANVAMASQHQENLTSEIDRLKEKLHETESALRASQQETQAFREEAAKLEQISTYKQASLSPNKGMNSNNNNNITEFNSALFEDDPNTSLDAFATATYLTNLVRKATLIWRLSLRHSRECKKADIINSKLVMRKHFIIWKRRFMLPRSLSFIESNKQYKILQQFMNAWKQFVVNEQTVRACENLHCKYTIKHFANQWKQAIALKHANTKQIDKAIQLHNKVIFKKSIKQWRKATHVAKQKSRVMVSRADESQRYFLKARAFKAWCQWMMQTVYANRAKVATFHEYNCRRLLVTGFITWKQAARDISHTKKIVDRANNHAKSLLIRRTLKQWRKCYFESLKFSIQKQQADVQRKKQLVKQAAAVWFSKLQSIKNMKYSVMNAYEHYFMLLRKAFLRQWKMFVIMRKSKRDVKRQAELYFARSVFLKWHGKTANIKTNKRLCHKQSRVQQTNDRRSLMKAFKQWKKFVKYTKLHKRMASWFADKAQMMKLKHYWGKWKHALFINTRRALNSAQLDMYTMHQSSHASTNKLAEVEMENINLVHKLHELTAEYSAAKASIKDKDEAIHVLEKLREENLIVESALRGEIESLKNQNFDLEQEVERLKYQIITRDETEKTTQHIFELQNAEQAINNVRAELDDKHTALERTQKQINALEATSSETQQKMMHAFEIAASLRKLLEEKENQLLEYEHLKNDHERLVRTSDSSIQTLQQQMMDMQVHLHSLQQRLAQTELESQSKDDEIKRLEFELDIFTQRDEISPNITKPKRKVEMNEQKTSPNRVRPSSGYSLKLPSSKPQKNAIKRPFSATIVETTKSASADVVQATAQQQESTSGAANDQTHVGGTSGVIVPSLALPIRKYDDNNLYSSASAAASAMPTVTREVSFENLQLLEREEELKREQQEFEKTKRLLQSGAASSSSNPAATNQTSAPPITFSSSALSASLSARQPATTSAAPSLQLSSSFSGRTNPLAYGASPVASGNLMPSLYSSQQNQGLKFDTEIEKLQHQIMQRLAHSTNKQ